MTIEGMIHEDEVRLAQVPLEATLSECIAVFNSLRSMGIPWEQEHFDYFQAVAGLKPRIVVDVGMHVGGGLWLMSRTAADDAILIGVEKDPELPMPGFASLIKPRQEAHVIIGDSHDDATVAAVKEICAGRMAGLTYIDADHSYEAVKHDWELYSPLSNAVAFHDVRHPDVPDPDNGVRRLWDEIRGTGQSQWFYQGPPCYGIGLWTRGVQ